jgi:hypothetical protein
MKVMNDTYTIAQAQANLPRLCRSIKRFVIARRDKPVYAMPICSEYADTRDVVYETFLRILENR